MSRDVCQSGNGTPVAYEGPDINSRDVFIVARQKLMTWELQIDAAEQKSFEPPAIKMQERDSAEQLSRPFEGKNRLRVAVQELSKPSFRDADPWNLPMGNGDQIGQLRDRR